MKAFGFHLLGSSCVLCLMFGGLFLGWYRWPGWYLTGVIKVAGIVGAVDVVLGPLVTLLIANPRKPGRVLARDIAVIVVVQLSALIYGITTLWLGRPLYYVFSGEHLEMVQAQDVSASDAQLALRKNPQLAPHWYSRPRRVWAPVPEDAEQRAELAHSGKSVILQPRFYRPWEQGLAALRAQLKPVDQMPLFSVRQKALFRQQLARQGIDARLPVALFMIGVGRPMVAIFNDRNEIQTLLMPS